MQSLVNCFYRYVFRPATTPIDTINNVLDFSYSLPSQAESIQSSGFILLCVVSPLIFATVHSIVRILFETSTQAERLVQTVAFWAIIQMELAARISVATLRLLASVGKSMDYHNLRACGGTWEDPEDSSDDDCVPGAPSSQRGCNCPLKSETATPDVTLKPETETETKLDIKPESASDMVD